MNFDFTDRDMALRSAVEGVFDGPARPMLENLESGRRELIRETTLHFLGALGRTGYLALGLRAEDEHLRLLAAQEAVAAACPSLFLAVEASVRLCGRLIARFGSAEQQSEILPALQEGRAIGSLALTEENMSLEGNPFATRGISLGSGFAVSGSKQGALNAPVADWIGVAADLEGAPAVFFVPAGTRGLLVGDPVRTLGYGGVALAEVRLDHCTIPAERVLRSFGGQEILDTIRSWEDQILTAAGLGLMRRSYEAALQHAKTHRSGGRPIVGLQEIGFKLAEILTLHQTARLLAQRAAWMLDGSDREAGVLVHCAKVFCAESAERIASQALQILGGAGYQEGNPAGRDYRDAKYLQIAGTSTEISRMKIGAGVLEARAGG